MRRKYISGPIDYAGFSETTKHFKMGMDYEHIHNSKIYRDTFKIVC